MKKIVFVIAAVLLVAAVICSAGCTMTTSSSTTTTTTDAAGHTVTTTSGEETVNGQTTSYAQTIIDGKVVEDQSKKLFGLMKNPKIFKRSESGTPASAESYGASSDF